ncbi:unnamed protein product [Didymodactylos carnosus]|nr:unnamed protein product [Didymodactylos carnosus]CAF4449006.1 unnamed protein product [Didymodactylos carnosus]
MLQKLSYQTFWDTFYNHPKNTLENITAYVNVAFTHEQIYKELKDDKTIFIIAEIKSDAVGYARLTFGNYEHGIIAKRPVELVRLYSTQEYLGKGVGTKLMEECIEIAKKYNCDVIWLGVWEHNGRAQSFYRKHGFEIVGDHIFYLGSDAQTDLLMQKNL